MADRNLYGWVVVGLLFLALSLSLSARSSLGLTMPIWETEFGWSRGFVSSVGALMLLVVAAVAPFAGNAVNSIGPRMLLTGGLTLCGVGVLLTSQMTQSWQLMAFFGMVCALGFGVVATHMASTTVAFYFVENRGLATGIATAGSTAGQLLVIPLLALILNTVGWRFGFATLGFAMLALAVVMWLSIRPQLPPQKADAHGGGASDEALSRRLIYLLKSPVFHILFWSYWVCGFTTSGVVETHLIPYAVTCGYPPLTSATAYGVLAAFNMLGMVISGYLTDRMHRPLLLGGIYLGRSIAFVLLMQIVDNPPILFMFAIVFGLFDFSTVPPTASLVASHLGLRIMGLAMGIISTGHALGGAAGAFMGGYLYDLFARYDWVWMASIALAIFAGLICFLIRENRAQEQLRPQPA